MSQVYINPTPAASYVGTEVTFATNPGALTRMFPLSDSFDPNPTQDDLENEDQRELLYDYQTPVHGLKGGGGKFSYYWRPDGTQLTASGATVAHPLGILLEAAFGGSAKNNGSTVQTSSTTTSVIVGTGHGTRFTAGQWILVEVSGAIEPTRVMSISTDTLTVSPALSGTPTTSGLVVNSYTYIPTQTNTKSLTLQHAMANNSSHQWTFVGCLINNLGLTLDRNGLFKLDFEFQCADYTGPSAQSISTSVATDTMAAPFAIKDATCILQAQATTTRTHYPVISVSPKLTLGNEFVPELGGTNGRNSTMRTGTRLFCETTVRIAGSDITQDSSNWTNQTQLQFAMMVPSGSGTTKRWGGIDMPYCVIVGKPKTIRDSGMVKTEIVLRSQINASGVIQHPFAIWTA